MIWYSEKETVRKYCSTSLKVTDLPSLHTANLSVKGRGPRDAIVSCLIIDDDVKMGCNCFSVCFQVLYAWCYCYYSRVVPPPGDIMLLYTSYSIISCPDKTRSYLNKQIQKSQHRDTRRVGRQGTQPSRISEKRRSTTGHNRYWNSAALVSRHVPVKDCTSKSIRAAQTGREESFLKNTKLGG